MLGSGWSTRMETHSEDSVVPMQIQAKGNQLKATLGPALSLCPPEADPERI